MTRQDFECGILDHINEAIEKMREVYYKELTDSILKENEFYIICGDKDLLIKLRKNVKDNDCEVLYEKYCDPTKVYVMRKIDYKEVL